MPFPPAALDAGWVVGRAVPDELAGVVDPKGTHHWNGTSKVKDGSVGATFVTGVGPPS